jgi:chromosome segregation ATPase
MPPGEYKDRSELQKETQDSFKEVEKLGEEQEGHQEDLERLQEKLNALKSSKGIYNDSDRSLMNSVELAIGTRVSSVETCKSQITEVRTTMESSLENLQRTIPKVQDRVSKMEDLAGSLNHQEVVVNINVEIQQHKEDIEDANDKSNKILQMIQIAGGIASAGTVALSQIQGFISALQSIGIMR